jgi:aryl carrier-like protein
MLPSAFVFLNQLPLTPNGKVDRKALPAPDGERFDLASTYVAPRNPTEQVLAQIWATVLGVKQVGIHDNFFDLGGDSLLVLRIIARARQAGLHLAPNQLFQSPTVAGLAEMASLAATVQPEQGDVTTGPTHLSPMQSWFFDHNFSEQHRFNVSTLFEVSQVIKLDPALLKETVRHLLIHHDALRLRFFQKASAWQQFMTAPDNSVPFSVIDLSILPEQEQIRVIETACNELQCCLDLSEGPLIRVVLFDLGADKSARLLVVIHHLVTDGFSNSIIMEDLITAYQQLSRGETVQLPAKTTSYKQWTKRLVEYAHSPEVQQELEYWQAKPDEAQLGILRLDFPDTIDIPDLPYQQLGALSVEETRVLMQEVLKTYDAQLVEVTLAVMAETIAEVKGDRSLFLDILRHGRDLPLEGVDLSRTVGWTVMHCPLLLRLGEATCLEDAIPLVRQQYRRPLNGGAGYNLLRYMSDSEEIKKTLLPHSTILFSQDASQQASPSPESLALFWPAREKIGHTSSATIKWPYELEFKIRLAGDQFHWSWATSQPIYRRSRRFGEILKMLCKR